MLSVLPEMLLMLGECPTLQGARDALPRGRTPHALTLTYKLSLIEGGKITPRLPMMNGWEATSICNSASSCAGIKFCSQQHSMIPWQACLGPS
jgi:hypothetical protein